MGCGDDGEDGTPKDDQSNVTKMTKKEDTVSSDVNGTTFLRKSSRAGGPVTCVAIRHYCHNDTGDDDDGDYNHDEGIRSRRRTRQSSSQGEHGVSTSVRQSRGRLMLFSAQGPYITRYDHEEQHTPPSTSSSSPSTSTSTVSTPNSSISSSILAFEGGGTIHGIHFVDDDDHDDDDHDVGENSDIPGPGFDSLVYGGKTIVFANLVPYDKMTVSPIKIRGPDMTQLAKSTTSLHVQDWVWTVKAIPFKNRLTKNKIKQSSSATTRVVIGYARHMIEVWDVTRNTNTAQPYSQHDHRHSLYVEFLHRVSMTPTTLITSMDVRFVVETKAVANKKDHFPQQPLTLLVATGDSFYNVWVTKVTSPMENACSTTDKRQRLHYQQESQRHLPGHKGVVHDVRFSDCCTMLASCSDDRSVRLWTRGDLARLPEQNDVLHDPDDDGDNYGWVQSWVGWGHTARIWSVVFVSSTKRYSSNKDVSDGDSVKNSSYSHEGPSFMSWIASVSEDGSARLWDIHNGAAVACLYHTSASSGLWSIDALRRHATIVVGATDGTISLLNISDYVCTERDDECSVVRREKIPIPDDRTETESIGKVQLTTKPKRIKKAKPTAQMIVGMKWWNPNATEVNSNGILIATREGSLMFSNVYAQTNSWIQLGGWWDDSLNDRFGVRAQDGCCMSIASDEKFDLVAIGTTSGDVVLNLLQSCEAGALQENRYLFQARALKAVQGLDWIYDAKGFASQLISLHVKSVAIWKIPVFNDQNQNFTQKPRVVLDLGPDTKGVPSCCCYDEKNSRMVIGDTRGNISLFVLPNENEIHGSTLPTSILSRVHQKAHVTSICLQNECSVISSGNDGCLHISYLNECGLDDGWSFPVYDITGITEIVSSKPNLVVSGYFGNTFIVMDVSSGHNFLRFETGGRQRILDHQFSSRGDSAFRYNVAVCMGKSEGSNSLSIQGLRRSVPPLTPQKSFTYGVNMHGETIFGASVFMLGDQGAQFFITGSEDCTAKISTWRNGRISDSIILTQQESCIRCITVSQIDQQSIVVAVGGGNFVLQFYLIGLLPGRLGMSVDDLRIHFMGKGVACKRKATIDHRINAVKAIPLLGTGRDHLVVAGDSNGNSQLYLIPEETRKGSSNTFGLLCPTSCRPLLCIDAIMVGCRVLLFIGTTGGDIIMYDLPGRSEELRRQWSDLVTQWTPLGQYQGHQMGTNAISARLRPLNTSQRSDCEEIIVVSGGDDQALTFGHIKVHTTDSGIQLDAPVKQHIVREASLSAIKDLQQIIRGGKRYVVCVGYSQVVSLWHFSTQSVEDVDGNENALSQNVVAYLPVDLGDINCLAVCNDFFAVCGMGMEMFELNLSE